VFTLLCSLLCLLLLFLSVYFYYILGHAMAIIYWGLAIVIACVFCIIRGSTR
jgi:hypothetical protein